MPEETTIRDGQLGFLEVWVSQYSVLAWLILGWNIGLVTAWIAAKRWTLLITSQRIEYVHGILGVQQESFELYRGQDTDYSQSPIQMIFGVGTVRILGNDATTSGIIFPTKNPSQIQNQLRGFIRDQRQEMGTQMRD
jgi:membrane protein YdbS with pleckstrin-like domain